MQNVTIHGIMLQDRSVEESVSSAVRFLRNSALNVIAYIDFSVAHSLYSDEAVREFIRTAALTEWGEAYLPEAVGINDADRMAQVEERRFLKEELHSMCAGDRTVALAAEDEDTIRSLEESVLKLEPDVNIVLRQVLEPPDGTVPESAINSINQCAPSMIISHMDYHKLAEWIKAASSMINVGVWFAIPDTMEIAADKKRGIFSGMKDFFRSRMIRMNLDRYKEV